MRRILIIGVILVGAWFVFQELNNAPQEEGTPATEETTTEETVQTEEGKDAEKPVVEEKTKKDVTAPVAEEETPRAPMVKKENILAVDKTNVIVPTEVAEKITQPAEETPVLYPTSTVKVFMYEWGIDLSSANVPAGNIAFQVINNGQFSHHFAIKGGTDFGKVVPGELATFVAPLEAGTITLYSPRQIDMENEMQETLYVQ